MEQQTHNEQFSNFIYVLNRRKCDALEIEMDGPLAALCVRTDENYDDVVNLNQFLGGVFLDGTRNIHHFISCETNVGCSASTWPVIKFNHAQSNQMKRKP